MKFCPKCGEKLSPENKRCPKCLEFLNMEDFMCDHVEDSDIKRNIDFFLKWSVYVLYASFILGVIAVIVGLALFEDSDGMSIMFCFGGALLVACGYILENNLKWKAYQLLTNLKKIK